MHKKDTSLSFHKRFSIAGPTCVFLLIEGKELKEEQKEEAESAQKEEVTDSSAHAATHCSAEVTLRRASKRQINYLDVIVT